MASLITQVRSKLFISSAHPSMHPLDGAYRSMLHGRSMDFEDLRGYEMGDQVRDIDWRASARLGQLLVKRTRATRMHTVMFVVDTGRTMQGIAPDERPKKDLAILAAGALGFLTVRHGDDLSLVIGDADGQKRVRGGRSEAALEHALRSVDGAVDDATAPGSVDALLDHVARTVSKRMILVVIADEAPFTDETERLVRRLRMQHDIVWMTIADADPVLSGRSDAYRSDVMSGWEVPGFAHGDQRILSELNALRDAEKGRRDTVLRRWKISNTTLRDQDTAVGEILAMLNARSRAA